MNKKNFFRTVGKAMATMLFAATVLTGFNSCVANEDNAVDTTPQPGGEVTEPYVEPTTDQLEVMVTADMPTAVLGQFDDNSVGAALVKRLSQTTNAIDDNTKLVLLDDNVARTLSEDDFYQLALIYLNGGYIALQRPTLGVVLAFVLGLEGMAGEIQDDILKENGVEIPEGAEASARSLEDSQLVRNVNKARALTRAEDDDPNAVIDELLIMSINAFYVIPPYNEERIVFSKMEDENGHESEPVEHKVKNLQNPYHYGRMADGAALWLNTKEQEKADGQQDEPAAARAHTRADADQVINSMISRTNEFTLPGHLWAHDDQGKVFGRENVSSTTIRSWSVYDFASKRDFYYVEENHHIRMGGQDSDKSNTLYWGPYKKEDWMWTPEPAFINFAFFKIPKTFSLAGLEGEGSDWAYYYGSWLSKSTHAMELEGNGEIQLEKSLPTTDNSQTTEIIAIGSTDGTSSTSGWSFGFNVGANAGASGSNATGGGTLGFNWGYSESTTTSHSTSFTMSTSHVSKDLAIVKNTDGNKVTWTYKEGHTPTVIWDKDWHEMAADILTNDIDIENKACWSVKKPSGSYILSWYALNFTKALYLNASKNHSKHLGIAYEDYDGFRLTPPRRFKKEWCCDIIVNGENLQPQARNLLRAELQKDINATMFDNRFYVAESKDDGVEVIKYNIGVASEVLKPGNRKRKMIEREAASLGIEKFIIEWFSDDPRLKDLEPFRIPVKVAN